VLPGISTEQLRSRLNRMVADGLLTRQRYREVPPRVDYELTERARDLMPVLGALGRWGFDWAWSAPRDGEAVDVGAVLRLAPPVSVSGRVACIVERRGANDGAGQQRAVLIADGGRVEIAERDAPTGETEATVTGSEAAWVRALGPDGDIHGLEISGDRRLAEELLHGFTAIAGRRVAAA
jgi:hypothetical protein